MLRSSGYGRSSPGVLSSSRAETQEFHIGSATVALEMRFGARPHTRLCALQRAVGGRPKPAPLEVAVRQSFPEHPLGNLN